MKNITFIGYLWFAIDTLGTRRGDRNVTSQHDVVGNSPTISTQNYIQQTSGSYTNLSQSILTV